MPADSVFVLAEPSIFHSPDVKSAGRVVDVGLLAEALIFYEKVFLGMKDDEQYARLVYWFKSQGKVDELIKLLQSGVLIPYYYAFSTLPGNVGGGWSLVNLQDAQQAEGPVFESRVARSTRLERLVNRRSQRAALDQAVMDAHIEVKAADFENGVENAKRDYTDPDRARFMVQLIYDELYREMGYLAPPEIRVNATEGNGQLRMDWNVDFDEVGRKLGPQLSLHGGVH